MVNAIESEKNFSVEGDLLIENSSFRDVAFDYSSKQKVTLYLVFVVCTAVISSFTFGYSLGAPNISENIIRDCQKDPAGFSLPPCIPMNSAQWGFVIGLFPIGGLVGGLAGSWCGKIFGRKKSLLLHNVLFLIGSLGISLSYNTGTFGAGRFIVGVASGLSTSIVPQYVVEISTINHKGTLGLLHQLAIVTGILIGMAGGWVFNFIPGWRYLFAFPACLCILQSIFLVFCVESPRYLILKGCTDLALESLKRLRGTSDVDDEFQDMTFFSDEAEHFESVSLKDFLTKRSFRKRLHIILACHFGQQLSGINSIIQYSTSLLTTVIGDEYSKESTIVLGVINLILTIISVWLVERVGRRLLIVSSAFGMTVSSVFFVLFANLDLGVLVVICSIIFLCFFACGLGPIAWLTLPEIIPTNAFTAATIIAMVSNWVGNSVVSIVFPSLSDALGDYSFVPFAFTNFFFGTVLYYTFEESKGRTLNEMTRLLES